MYLYLVRRDLMTSVAWQQPRLQLSARFEIDPGLTVAATISGEVAEWSKAPHSKCGVPARVPRVRIPASPPHSLSVKRVLGRCALVLKAHGLSWRTLGCSHPSRFHNPQPRRSRGPVIRRQAIQGFGVCTPMLGCGTKASGKVRI